MHPSSDHMAISYSDMLHEDDVTLEAVLALVSECDVSFNATLHNEQLDVLTDSQLLPPFAWQDGGELYQSLQSDVDVTDMSRAMGGDCDLKVELPASGAPVNSNLSIPTEKNACVHKSKSETILAAGKKKRAKRPLKRELLIQLRNQVRSMEEQLHKLTIEHQNRPDLEEKVKKPRSLWKAIAKRQFESRKKSEIENQRLRRFVQVQIRAANRLQRAFQRRAITETIKAGLGITEHPNTQPRSAVNLNEMMMEIDLLYVGVDKMLEVDRLDRSGNRIRCWSGNPSALESVVIEFIDKQDIPFDLRVSERALWKSLGERGINDFRRVGSKNIDTSGSTIIAHWTVTMKPEMGGGYVQVYRVSRKYVKADRVVFVSTMRVEPFLTGQRSSIGISYREAQWNVLTRGEEGVAGPTTRIESHSTISQHVLDRSRAQQFLTIGYSSLAIKGWEGYVEWNQEVFENLLLEEGSKNTK